MIKSRVFISCGQHGSPQDPTSELGVATELKKLLYRHGFEVYIALEQHSLKGFTENILPVLEQSEYYLLIDFKREEIRNEKEPNCPHKYRGSLFSHQELGIAAYLKKDLILIFQEAGVLERDGIKGFIHANPITFYGRITLPTKILDEIIREGWKTGWRNELLMERTDDDYADALNRQTNRLTRYFHIRVTNNHNLKTARECLVYLTKITNLSNGIVQRPPLVEFKWQPMISESVSILPFQSRNFDAFSVDIQAPNTIHLGINSFLIDFTGYYNPYTITGSGDYELEFVIVSREFTLLSQRFRLHIGTNLNELRLVRYLD